MLKDQFMEFYANPFRSMPRLPRTLQFLTVLLPALCLALPSARAQSVPAVKTLAQGPSVHTVKTLAQEQGLPTPLIGRIPTRLLKAEAGARARWMERPVMDDPLRQTAVVPASGPLVGRERPRTSTATTVTVTSTVQTQDLTYSSYSVTSAGVLTGATPNNQDPFFSTTETYVYFSSDRTSAADSTPTTTFHLFATSPGGSTTPIQLTGLAGQPTASSAGETFLGERYPSAIGDNTIAYAEEVKTAAGGIHYDLYTATLTPTGNGGISLTSPQQITGLTQLTSGITQLGPYVSIAHPSIVSGGTIAFAGVAYDPTSGAPIANAPSHIYIYQGTYPVTQLTGGTASEMDPALSPDEQVVAFDSNATGYASSGSPGLTSSGTKTNRDIWLANFSGTLVNQFTQPAGTTGVSNNIQPIWSLPVANTQVPLLNPDGNFTYLFFASDRNAGVYDIYYLRAVDRNPVPAAGNLVVDLEGQDNQTNTSGALIGTNLAERVNTSSPNHVTDNATILQQPIENFYPAVSTLNQYISVVYLSNRYVINGLDDNPINPTNPLANQSLLPAGAQDVEPLNLATNATPNQIPSNYSYDLLSSRLVAIEPPQLLTYDPTNNEIVHVEDTSAQPSQATRYVGAGNTARFILRLSDRQTGVSKAFIQVKNPNSKYQDALRLEHKVFSRLGGSYSDHSTEGDESTTTFLLDNANGTFDLNPANNPGGLGGPSIYGNAVAGNNGGAVEIGDVLPYTGTPVTTFVTMAVMGTPPPVISSLQVASDANFQPGDTVSVQAGASLIYLVLNGISGPSNGIYTFSFKNPRKVAADIAVDAIVSVVDRFDPQGQEVDCEAMDAVDYPAATQVQADDFTVPLFTPGVDDAPILNGLSTLQDTPGVDADRGPLNAASGNAVWLQLTPFVPSSDTAYAVAVGATVLPVTETSGIVPGDSVQIGSGAGAETVTVSSLAVAPPNDKINGVAIAAGTPLIILDGAAPTVDAHAAGQPVTLIFSPSGGVLYEASFTTPTAPSDYYLDVVAFDNATYPLTNGDGVTTPDYDIGSGYANQSINWRITDNIWGFTTQTFAQQSGVLLVNDYDLPQKFFTGRFGQTLANNLPITEFGAESYLTDIEVNDFMGEDGVVPVGGGNFGGDSHAVTPNTAQSLGVNTATRGYILSNNDDVNTFLLGYPNTLGANSYADQDQEKSGSAETVVVPTDPEDVNASVNDSVAVPLPQSQKYDIWRILSRGPVPASVLSSYQPTTQYQPDVTGRGTHPVQVADACVIWSSPFAGALFIGSAKGSGTITDPGTQTNLETFVNAGGRLFVEGIDIGYSLTNDNSFYTDYLRASFVADNVGFTTGAYTLAGKGSAASNYISNDAYRNSDGVQVVHRGFSMPNPTGTVTFDQPYKNTITISHQPFDTTFNGFGGAIAGLDNSLRTDGSLNAGLGDFQINQGYIDAIAPNDPAGDPAPFFRPASVDLSGTGTTNTGVTGHDDLLYYFGVVPLAAGSATSAAVTAQTTVIPVASTSGIAPGDTLTIGTGTASESFTVSSLSASSTGTPEIIASANLTKPHAAGSPLTRTAGSTYTNFVGYSSFGIETLSQELVYEGFGANPTTDAFVSYNQRTNIMHNLICTMRTGTITGIVRSTLTGNTPVGGAFVEVTLIDSATGKPVIYTAITQGGAASNPSTGHYTIEGAIPGLYAYNANAAGFSTTHTVATTLLHGGDTVTQDISVNPVSPGAVTVSVVDTAGNPIPGVVVTLTEAHNAITYTATTATNSNSGAVLGTAVFPSVLTSSFGYYVTYVAPAYDTSTDPSDPTRPNQTPEDPVIVQSNQTTAVKTILSPKPATVFGLVTASNGPLAKQPLPGVTITFTNAAGAAFTTTSGAVFNGPDSATGNPLIANYPLNDNSSFTLPASPNGVKYTYTAALPNYVTATGTIKLTTAQQLRLNLSLPEAGTIILNVINSATGQAITPPVTASLTPASGTTTTIVSGAAGTPVLPNTTPGYTITLPQSVGGAKQTKPVAAGSSVTFTFIVTPAPGAVTGTITDQGTGAPIAGAVVTLTNTSGQTFASAPTGANGVYTIANVPSGRVYSATAAAANFTPVTVASVSVTPAMTTTQDFALASVFGTLTGAITDSVTGAGVPGATVTITSGTHTYTGTTNASGVYTITGILASASPYTATITGPNYLPKTVTGIVIPADGTLTEPTITLVSSIIHRYGAGLQMFSAPYDYTGQPLASVLQGEVGKTTGLPVDLVAAWVTLAGAYALTPTSPCETLHLGQGYWARFGATGGQLMATGVADTSATANIPLHAGWNMIGDPYTVSKSLTALTVQDSAGNTPLPFTTASGASVNFVDPQLYSYDQTSNAYTLVEVNNPFGGNQNPTIDPYVGYWIYAYTNCTLIFTK